MEQSPQMSSLPHHMSSLHSKSSNDHKPTNTLLQSRYSIDAKNKHYDEQVLLNLFRREKTQIDVLKSLQVLADDRQQSIASTMEQIMLNFFKEDAENSEIPDPLEQNLMRIKLITLMFLQIALTHSEQDQPRFDTSRAQFFFYCSYNMAIKSSSVLITNQDMYNWISQQQVQSVTYWNGCIFQFEEFLYKQLNWNIDLVTPQDVLNFFVEHHFASLLELPNEFKQCQDNLIVCFLCKITYLLEIYLLIYHYLFIEQRWSTVTIAMGCLASSLNSEDYLYLQYLMTHSYAECSFDLEAITNVIVYLEISESMLDLSVASSSSVISATSIEDQSLNSNFDGEKTNAVPVVLQAINSNNNAGDDKDQEEEDICLEADEEDLGEDNDDGNNNDDDDDDVSMAMSQTLQLSSTSSVATLISSSHAQDLSWSSLNQKRSHHEYMSAFDTSNDYLQSISTHKNNFPQHLFGNHAGHNCFIDDGEDAQENSDLMKNQLEAQPQKRLRATLDFN